MINPTGNAPQFPNTTVQSGVQNTPLQQNPQDKRAENNKPQENRSAEASNTQRPNDSQNKNFQAIAESILANRQSQGTDAQFQPAVERGAIVDITV
jgi:hypothetical protein